MLLNDSDLKTYEDAQDYADMLMEQNGSVYLPVDRGPNVWPRFSTVKAPVVGEPVSMAFNGDYYPKGFITKVSASYKTVTTDTGTTFRRRKNTSMWKTPGGTWSMVHGHHRRLNPHF